MRFNRFFTEALKKYPTKYRVVDSELGFSGYEISKFLFLADVFCSNSTASVVLDPDKREIEFEWYTVIFERGGIYNPKSFGIVNKKSDDSPYPPVEMKYFTPSSKKGIPKDYTSYLLYLYLFEKEHNSKEKGTYLTYQQYLDVSKSSKFVEKFLEDKILFPHREARGIFSEESICDSPYPIPVFDRLGNVLLRDIPLQYALSKDWSEEYLFFVNMFKAIQREYPQGNAYVPENCSIVKWALSPELEDKIIIELPAYKTLTSAEIGVFQNYLKRHHNIEVLNQLKHRKMILRVSNLTEDIRVPFMEFLFYGYRNIGKEEILEIHSRSEYVARKLERYYELLPRSSQQAEQRLKDLSLFDIDF